MKETMPVWTMPPPRSKGEAAIDVTMGVRVVSFSRSYRKSTVYGLEIANAQKVSLSDLRMAMETLGNLIAAERLARPSSGAGD